MKGVKGLTKKNVGRGKFNYKRRVWMRKNIGGTNRTVNKRGVFSSVLFQLLAWAKGCHPWIKTKL